MLHVEHRFNRPSVGAFRALQYSHSQANVASCLGEDLAIRPGSFIGKGVMAESKELLRRCDLEELEVEKVEDVEEVEEVEDNEERDDAALGGSAGSCFIRRWARRRKTFILSILRAIFEFLDYLRIFFKGGRDQGIIHRLTF